MCIYLLHIISIAINHTAELRESSNLSLLQTVSKNKDSVIFVNKEALIIKIVLITVSS